MRRNQSAQVSVSFRLSRNKKLFGSRCVLAISFVIDEEERLVFAVIEFRNGDRTTQAATECIEVLRRFCRKSPNRSVQCAILEIFESGPVPLICPVLCGEGHVSYLRKFRVIVKGSDLHLRNAFGRRVRISESAVRPYVGRRDTIHRKAHLRCCCSTNSDVSLTVFDYARRECQVGERACGHGARIQWKVYEVSVALRIRQCRIFCVHGCSSCNHVDRFVYRCQTQFQVDA